jgi:hypothetical protein
VYHELASWGGTSGIQILSPLLAFRSEGALGIESQGPSWGSVGCLMRGCIAPLSSSSEACALCIESRGPSRGFRAQGMIHQDLPFACVPGGRLPCVGLGS